MASADAQDAGAAPSTGAGGRRELGGAVTGTALAGGLALACAGQPWIRVTAERPPPLPPATASLTGSEVAAMVPAAGLLLLAAAVTLVAVRGLARAAVGLVVAAAGGVLGWSGLRTVLGGAELAPGDLPGLGGSSVTRLTTSVSAGWPLAAAAAGAVAVLAGALVVLRARGWPSMGRRYERGGTGAAARGASDDDRASADDRATAAWRALDRGEDPTDPAPAEEPGSSGGRPSRP